MLGGIHLIGSSQYVTETIVHFEAYIVVGQNFRKLRYLRWGKAQLNISTPIASCNCTRKPVSNILLFEEAKQ